LKSKLLLQIITVFYSCFAISQTTYIEGFNTKGYPANLPNNAYWMFYNDIHPNQNNWDKFIPGDGNAYITVDADKSNDTDYTYPYQAMVFGGIGENHRLEVRMKGAAVDGGLTAFIFTYTQTGSIFNEVDIEVVAQDLQSGIPSHDIHAPNGWTDARFNTWRNANEITEVPFTGSQKPVVDANNNKISLIDGEFHTYTIDWRENQVDFFIDSVLQESFNTTVATGWSEVIIGYRNLPWAGNFRWTGNHTMVIDYFKIEPLEAILSVDSVNLESQISIYPNPTKDEINLRIADASKIKKMELINVISSKVMEINNFDTKSNSIQKIDISSFPKGVYFLKTELSDGNIITKKILKL
jgi:hypothetical protein